MVNNITSLENASIATNKKSTDVVDTSNSMNKDDFLKLFVEQLKNQDPMNPMDNYEVASQLAQYSSLEQLVNLNDSFKNFMQLTSQNAYFQGINLIGKDVEYIGNKFNYDPEKDENITIKFKLDNPSKQVNINIYDEQQNFVKSLSINEAEAGENSVEWNGMNNNGTKAANGTYTYEVIAYDDEGQDITYTPYGKGIVNNISYDKENSTATFKVNNDTVDITDIINIGID